MNPFAQSVAGSAPESSGRWNPPFAPSVAASAPESSGRWNPPFALSVAASAAESKGDHGFTSDMYSISAVLARPASGSSSARMNFWSVYGAKAPWRSSSTWLMISSS